MTFLKHAPYKLNCLVRRCFLTFFCVVFWLFSVCCPCDNCSCSPILNELIWCIKCKNVSVEVFHCCLCSLVDEVVSELQVISNSSETLRTNKHMPPKSPDFVFQTKTFFGKDVVGWLTHSERQTAGGGRVFVCLTCERWEKQCQDIWFPAV